MSKKVKRFVIAMSIWSLGFLTIGVTIFLFAYIFWKGKGVISFEFLTEKPGGLPFGTDGGIFPALMGSLYLGSLSAFIGGSLGIGCAAYLSFAEKKKIFYRCVRVSVLGLSGIPSIIFGLVSYTFLIYKLGFKRCLFSAAITIAVMILPFVAIRAQKIFEEKGVKLLKESICLGISREYTILKLILPSCFVELLSTIALGMAFGMGAVAPILYTGVVMQAEVPQKLSDPFMSLPYHLYMLVNNGFSLEYAYGTALVLMTMLLVIQIICRAIAWLSDRE